MDRKEKNKFDLWVKGLHDISSKRRTPYYHSTAKRQTAVQHNAIHRMNHYLPISAVITYNTIHWIVIFPVDSIIHPLNWAQVIKINFLRAQQHPIKGHNIHKHIKLSLPCEKRIWNTVNGMLGDLLQSIAGNPWVTPKMEIKREDINLHIITATLCILSAWKHVVKEHVMKAEERV